MKKFLLSLIMIGAAAGVFAQKQYHEQYRPQIHFSPPAHWMNDPNGMVYYKGVYHLFYQHYPKATVWGPMHWGHATSRDMIHWTNQPIALYPDSLGDIFSGSAVVDINNTSGFGKSGQPPLVAIFTSAKRIEDKAGAWYDQNQSIAYSNDAGKTWHKYGHNPVLKNPNVKDFRDPKVSWYAAGKKWIMTLAVKDHIEFYSSPNLKDWTKESEFGQAWAPHDGAWECPDLFPITATDGKTIWVLIVNIGAGGPQGGSATQYFTGSFDGKTFTSNYDHVRWLDQGSDEYAGITWSNTGDRRIFLGWMSNWVYATVVPTGAWRSATTIPRELKLIKVGSVYHVSSEPVKELNAIKGQPIELSNGKGDIAIGKLEKNLSGQFELSMSIKNMESFSVTFSNEAGEKLIAGFEADKNEWFIDRTRAGESGFNKDFAKRCVIKRIATGSTSNLTIIMDAASVELFADHGLTTMTSIFFPKTPLNKISVAQAKGFFPDKVTYTPLKSIWP